MKVHERHDHERRTGRSSAVGLGCGLVLGVLLVAAPASADERPPEPMLSIAVDNGRTSAEVGDTLSYTITVDNIGTDAVSNLRVTQTMPKGLTFGTADRGGAARKGMVVWSLDLPAGGTRALHTTMTVGSTPDAVLRMASVACASLSAKKAPLVCATHSDELPAGNVARTQDEAAAAVAAGPTSTSDGDVALRIGLVVGGVAALAALVLMILRRRRPRLVANQSAPARQG